MQARESGKQVAVLVELKARFDEQSNTDIDLLTPDEAIGADATELFNFLTGYSKQESYRKFLVAPVALRNHLTSFIERETACGEAGWIANKVNSLIDPRIIRALYTASQAGVRVDLIVRGICGLRPDIKGVSEEMRVLSIVDRFLQHSRIYYFHNRGESDVYIGSADLMPRNLDRRVELLVPPEDPTLQAEILKNIFEVQLRDTAKGYWLQPDGSYLPAALELRSKGSEAPLFNSQSWFLHSRATASQPQLAPAAPSAGESKR